MNDMIQSPAPGEREVRFVGDIVRFTLRRRDDQPWPPRWRAFLRTNLGRAAAARSEIIASVERERPPALGSWHDIPLKLEGSRWNCEVPLAEVGCFRAKAYVRDERGWQHWPEGPDVSINVQPDFCRTGNIIYCAFTRMFGPTRTATSTVDPKLDARLEVLDRRGYTVIPPSGKLRDLVRALPHVFGTLGCRILHLLPVNPTPTVYARFGRFGSPYAAGDLLAIDPALVEFDRRTTGLDQFRELAWAVHERGGRLFLDMAINHTGWGSTLQEEHPEWFARDREGRLKSPSAWGTVWEDLVELEQHHPGLRRHFGDVFLEWCRRGVDGFRCDAGYQVPLPVWQYVTARVRQVFPDTVFLLEGLGGAWETTESLLTEGGLQWAYSELFQNYDGVQVAGYLDHALRQSQRVGLLVHYSETHDNERLAAKGRAWSLLRNRLCALASVNGAFGFTCGVEWLAPERVNVHSSRGLAWDSADNIVSELSVLNRLLADHPCFFDGARLTRLSEPGSPVYGLRRVSAEGLDEVLVLANTDVASPQPLRLHADSLPSGANGGSALVDLLDQEPPDFALKGANLIVTLPPAAVFCLASSRGPRGLAGEAYRRRKACEARALSTLCHHLPVEMLGAIDVVSLGKRFSENPAAYLSALTYLTPATAGQDVESALDAATTAFPRVVTWEWPERNRVVPVPPEHWLLVRDDAPFRATLAASPPTASVPQHAVSIPTAQGHIACFAPRGDIGDASLTVDRFVNEADRRAEAPVRFLPARPHEGERSALPAPDSVVLLTNERGGMARLRVDLGSIESKYDCLLAANLHPRVPVDRHVFAKRARVWINADGFISPLDAGNLLAFSHGPPARWRFLAHAGDGREVEIGLEVGMIPGRNTTVLRFSRVDGAGSDRKSLPPEADVRLTVRVDIEDRGFHAETKRGSGVEGHFAKHCQSLAAHPTQSGTRSRACRPDLSDPAHSNAPSGRSGFVFTPTADRELRVWTDAGEYHPQPEWCESIPHPIEQSRGQIGVGDAFSPGWFELCLDPGRAVALVVCADPRDPTPEEVLGPAQREQRQAGFEERLAAAAGAFVVRRDAVRTVIAGYPWFLDWGRDTLICARGLLAAGMRETVIHLLQAFGRFEEHGTLPNAIHGEDASNRDTSDAPLWYGIVCEELAAGDSEMLHALRVDAGGRTIADVLRSIAVGYARGTPNGIRMDPASALIWSPSHFTWMDTNHPPGTPREGYPVEIQALWIRLLRHLDRLRLPPAAEPWDQLARRAQSSLSKHFWLEDQGWPADVLEAGPRQSAASATPQRALRPNCLFSISFGLIAGEQARRTAEAARKHLLVPGALRSLAPLPVDPPLAIHGPDGRTLNDPKHPYWGRYAGDEDTQRKPAYHNGTAWVWMLPIFCEAMVRAWDCAPGAQAAAQAYLGGSESLLDRGCLGHLPEILDGDAPHRQRGCDAQAWSVTEALRVWRWLDALACSPG
ncbi:MAG: glycogen debranching enzyme N-terminal domain-containing protein [Verrucomicrobia bacterium]|nr:glycogen debranching enzyme N-terminal domain-containing protein [Verrucomicrobiota bacterium]NMD20012.1 amylo-alpha-1,6-glucosidase [Verrucomicrobiota bacterium]